MTVADLETVKAWFNKAGAKASQMGKDDSATLWRDGLGWLEILEQRNVALSEALSKISAIKQIMPRDDHSAGMFYQARLCDAQNISDAALAANGGGDV